VSARAALLALATLAFALEACGHYAPPVRPRKDGAAAAAQPAQPAEPGAEAGDERDER
jgi:predicted small lipoprotein YifL